MSYQILRTEDTVDKNNNPEMFIQVQFTDSETGTIVPYATWVQGETYTLAKDDINSLVASWENDIIKAHLIEEPIVNTNSVTMRQARLALLHAGLLEAVEIAVTNAGPAAKIEWEYATTVDKDWPLVNSLVTSLGLSDFEIDNLFTAARRF